jgi:hypothetical protein
MVMIDGAAPPPSALDEAQEIAKRDGHLSGGRGAGPQPHPYSDEETKAAFGALQRNCVLNFCVRVGLYLGALAALAVAIYYTLQRGDSMVGVLLDHGSGPSLDTRDIVALLLPDIVLLIMAMVCLLSALYIQSRGMNDFELGIEGIGRLRREADAGVSRSRTATHVLEETMENAKRAFRLQLWLSRSLFVVCLVLFGLAVASAVLAGHVDGSTLVLGGGSLVGLLLATTRDAPEKIGAHLANVTQIETIVSGTIREMNVLEEYLYQVLEMNRTPESTGTAGALLAAGTKDMCRAIEHGVLMIEHYGEPGSHHEPLAPRVAES